MNQVNEIRYENAARNTHNVVADWLFAQPEIKSVLDVPCGKGAFVDRCIDRGLTVSAADCDDLCESQGVDFRFANMNDPLPFETNSFDAVVCIDGIEHIERPFDFIEQCGRVIRKDGAVVVSTPNISSLRSRWRWLLTGFHNKCKTPLDEINPNPLHHVNMLSFSKLRYMLHRAGFEIETIATNRCKAMNWLYAPLYPMTHFMTKRVFQKEEKDPGQKRRNAEILKQLHSKPILFGETMIIMARNRRNEKQQSLRQLDGRELGRRQSSAVFYNRINSGDGQLVRSESNS